MPFSCDQNYTMVNHQSSPMVNIFSATKPTMNREQLAHRRFRLLMEQIAAERERGWQRWLADKIGVSAGMISSIVAGNKEPGMTTIAGAIEKMGIDEAYFFDASAGPSPEYKKFVNIRGSVRATAHATATITAVHDDPLSTWDRFLLMPEAQKLSQEALLHAKALKGHGGATAEMLLQAARGFDAGRKSAESGDLVTGTRPIFREEVPAGKRALAPARKR